MFSSCSASKLLNRAIKKDPTILKETVITDTLTLKTVDSIPYLVNDTLHYKLIERHTDTIIQYKYNYITKPKTRQETRLEYKRDIKYNHEKERTERLRVRMQKRVDVVALTMNKRLNQTIVRQENKRSLWWLWLLIGFALSFILKFILRFYGIIK